MKILPISVSKKDLERFEAKYMPEPTSGCWIWIGAMDRFGYGRFLINNENRFAHRTSYSLFKNEIPYGVLICHTCDNRWCVNPDHLYMGTHTENNLDSYRRKRRCHKGEHSPKAILTEKQVLEIRASNVRPHRVLADMYGVGFKTIRSIRYRESWKHI